MDKVWQLFSLAWENKVWASAIVNVVVLILWLRNKVFQDEFLVGRWEGALKKESTGRSQDYLEIKCTLMITKRKGAAAEGFLHYRKVNLSDDSWPVLTEGLDRLGHYHADWMFVQHKTWEPAFTRVFHNCKHQHNTSPAIYNFQCKIDKLFFKPCMSVRVKHVDGWWKGHWSKH